MYKITCLLCSFIILASCTSTRPYQPDGPTGQTCLIDDEDVDNCEAAYYRKYENYDLGFVEFSERGNVYDTEKLQDVLENVEAKATNDGVITVVFVHGWLNNAQENNQNLGKFRGVLHQLAEGTERFGSDRRVVGLFVGWRGASITWPFFRTFTFWNRKNVAQNLGSGAVTRLLLELDRINRLKVRKSSRNRNFLITVGHSFGGAIVLSAVKDVLLDRLITTRDSNQIVPSIGDEVVLLNPAIEANQILPLVDVARGRGYRAEQNPILTIVSSDKDSATHKAFPAGQLFGTLAVHKQEDLDRSWYVDRDTQEPVELREEDLDGITIGNFSPFLTHRIRLEETDGKNNGCSIYKITRCTKDHTQCKAMGWNRTDPSESISRLPPLYPLRFLKTDGTIMKDHSDIFGPKVSILLRGLIENRLTNERWNEDASDWKTIGCTQ